MFGVRYDPDNEFNVSASSLERPNLKKRKRDALKNANVDEQVSSTSSEQSNSSSESSSEEEDEEDESEKDEHEEDLQRTTNNDDMEIDGAREASVHEYETKHQSVFDKFKQSAARDTKQDSTEDVEEEIETQDLAPLPQPQLPRDRRLQSTSHYLKNLDWLTKPEYISTTETKPFSAYALSPSMVKNLETLAFDNAFAVQVGVLNKMIPELGANKIQPDAFGDVLVNASTGSGKTLAYSIPVIESLRDRVVPRVRAIVLVPTKPLINQVRTTMLQLSQGTSLQITSLKSDISIQEESEKLKSSVPDVIISTPGRLVEHLGLSSVSLSSLRFLVVDEADRLLNQSFQNWSSILINKIKQEQQYDIANNWSLKIQKLVFSATLTTDAGKLSALDFYKPRLLIVNDSQHLVNELFSVPATLTEHNLKFGVAKSSIKPLILAKFLISQHKTSDVLIFTKSNESSIRLSSLLQLLFDVFDPSVQVAFMNSTNNRTSIRTRILKDFATRKINILVATDLIARGLDLTSIHDVINYDLPNSSREYVHRVGRTARANQPGDAYNLIFGKGELKWFNTFSKDVSRNDKEVEDVELDLKSLISADDEENVYSAALSKLQALAQK
ncbi:uncharacterized protein LODBEIA_P18580 [Lodderomyces beijingensis]|uniref:ATP-dependent RNA helicase n=1 Tax=Lodderomyces beijingensis TaxID=1775926 RepID=A0ABP0ZHK1_9ASCO